MGYSAAGKMPLDTIIFFFFHLSFLGFMFGRQNSNVLLKNYQLFDQ